MRIEEKNGRLKENLGKNQKKIVEMRGKKVEGMALAEIVGENGIEVEARDGYTAHFTAQEVSSLFLVGDDILSPHEGLSVKNVVRIKAQKKREPISVISDFSNIGEKTGIISGVARELQLTSLLPPSFSYTVVYSHDGYHASFSADEARTLSLDNEGNLCAPKSRKARRVRDVARIEVY